VIYYMAQAILRIAQQAYITRAFYGHDEALGRQAQRAGERARELAKEHAEDGGGGGFFAQARRDLTAAKSDRGSRGETKPAATPSRASSRPSKRTTEPKNRPTPSAGGPAGRPKGTSTSGRPGGARSKSPGKRRK
jgi:YidC/Oxa1 family membrane protein insertase